MSRGERLLLWSSTLAVAVSGVVYAFLRYAMAGHDPFSAYHHPLQPWALDAHLLAAPALLLALGWLWGTHVLPKLHGEPGSRNFGRALVGLVALMTASGYVLQISAAEGLRMALAWTHGLAGASYLGILVGHAMLGRRAARRRDEAQESRSLPPAHAASARRTAR